MVHAAPSYLGYEDYLEAEQASTIKHEWLDGAIYAMAGGTLEHNRLAGNVHTALRTALAKCEVFQADAMIYVRATHLSTYADVTVVRGPIESQKVERKGRVIGEALLNPVLIVEVLSDSTADYDRGEKFAHYMRLPSLREFLLVAQDAPKLEVFRRPERGRWVHEHAGVGERLQILGFAMSVDDIYRRAV
jgi:Uma2 family endonuclease